MRSSEVLIEKIRRGPPLALCVFLLLLAGIIGVLPTRKIGMWTGKMLLAEWTLIAFFALVYIKNWWRRIFLLWCLFILLSNYNKIAFLTFYVILIYSLFFQMLVNRIREKDISLILDGICVIALMQIFWMGLQFFNIDPLFNPTGWRGGRPLVGFLLNRGLSGAFLAISFPAFFRKRWLFFTPVIMTALVGTQALSAVIATCVAIIFFGMIKIKNKRTIVIFLMITLMFLALYIGTVEENRFGIFLSGSGRFAVWKNTIFEFISLKPFIGWGLGQFEVAYPAISKVFLKATTRFSSVHNEFLQIATEGGIPKLLIVTGYIMSLFINFFRNIASQSLILAAMAVVAMVSANSTFLMHTTIGILVIVILALLEKTGGENAHTLYGAEAR